jgi:DNA-directed RNA polymerase specialized sigma24 family protein
MDLGQELSQAGTYQTVAAWVHDPEDREETYGVVLCHAATHSSGIKDARNRGAYIRRLARHAIIDERERNAKRMAREFCDLSLTMGEEHPDLHELTPNYLPETLARQWSRGEQRVSLGYTGRCNNATTTFPTDATLTRLDIARTCARMAPEHRRAVSGLLAGATTYDDLAEHMGWTYDRARWFITSTLARLFR